MTSGLVSSNCRLNLSNKFLQCTIILCIALFSGLLRLPISAAGHDSAVQGAVANSSQPLVADLSSCPNLRIAIINGVPYHYEVIAGLLHLFRPYLHRTDVYLNRYTRATSGDGVWDILRRFKPNFRFLTPKTLSSIEREKPSYDLVILVSPEYELDENAQMLQHIQRRLTVAVIHNSDSSTLPRLFSVAEGGGSRLKLVTLAPHIARSLSATTGRPADWVLAAFPYKPGTNCLQASEVDLMGLCLRGFAVQGKFSNQRRNYTALWSQLQARRADINHQAVTRLLHISVLGKGSDERLNIPPDVLPRVSLLKRLAFRGFYETIHHTFALLPLFGTPRYYTDKFSSTVLTSLISGTPIVAERRFLEAYSMFSERSVYLQAEGEQEVDVMLRVVRLPAAELLGVRRELVEVRRAVNARAGQWYAQVLMELCNGGGGGGGGGGSGGAAS